MKKKRKEAHKNIFCGPSKIFKNFSWPINICLKIFMAPAKILCPLLLYLNLRSLSSLDTHFKSFIRLFSLIFTVLNKIYRKLDNTLLAGLIWTVQVCFPGIIKTTIKMTMSNVITDSNSLTLPETDWKHLLSTKFKLVAFLLFRNILKHRKFLQQQTKLSWHHRQNKHKADICQFFQNGAFFGLKWITISFMHI